MDPTVISTLFAVGGTIAAGGAAFGGVRYGLNGMREAVKRIERKLDRMDTQVADNRVEIARLAILREPRTRENYLDRFDD